MFTQMIASIKASGRKLDSMEDLLIEELKDIYDAEKQIVDALPQMEDAAWDPRVKSAFHLHLEESKRQQERLDRVFQRLDQRPEGGSCDGMKGLIAEGTVLVKAEGDPRVKDAALLAAAQRVEHYEIAAYGSARAFANYLGRQDIADLLQQTLDEEGDTDRKLTDLAYSGVNEQAARSGH